MSALTIDEFADALLRDGMVPLSAVLDGSFAVTDVSRRNRNYRASWSEGVGVLLKQPNPLDETTAFNLRNEAGFYAACLRMNRDPSTLFIASPLPSFVRPPALALRLVRNAVPLWEYREAHRDTVATYSSLGDALAKFHRSAATDEWQADKYFRELPVAPPWVFTIHQPALVALRDMSGAQLAFLEILQRKTTLGACFERLDSKLRVSSVIHGDLKADNILVSDDSGFPRVTLVDWEAAQKGDPALDIGAVLQDLLASWLETLTPTRAKDMHELLADREPLRALHPSFRAFWSSYGTAAALEPGARDELLTKSVECSAASLVQRAYELAQRAAKLPNHAVTMLQLAVNIFSTPASACLLLYGLPLGARRRAAKA